MVDVVYWWSLVVLALNVAPSSVCALVSSARLGFLGKWSEGEMMQKGSTSIHSQNAIFRWMGGWVHVSVERVQGVPVTNPMTIQNSIHSSESVLGVLEETQRWQMAICGARIVVATGGMVNSSD